jgi:hypothetical protein
MLYSMEHQTRVYDASDRQKTRTAHCHTTISHFLLYAESVEQPYCNICRGLLLDIFLDGGLHYLHTSQVIILILFTSL